MRIIKILLAVFILLFIGDIFLPDIMPASSASNVYAEGEEGGSDYTPEQKQAAKAWLSAHGYPPTRAGAAQAYQDFLDGKLDDDPDVRRYKGLDNPENKSTTGPTNGQTGETPKRDRPYAKGSEETDEGTGETGGLKASNESEEVVDSDLNFDNLEDIIEEDVAEEIKIDLSMKLPIMDNKDMYLVYDKYEDKGNEKNDTQFIVIISIISVMVIISVVMLLMRDTHESKSKSKSA